MSYAVVSTGYGYATVGGIWGAYAVISALISYAVVTDEMPSFATDGEGVPGQLKDDITGALLFDAVTGLPLVW